MSGRVPVCDICGERNAEYVCSSCGRLVCRYDFDPYLRVCTICSKSIGKGYYEHMENVDVFKWFLVIFIGFILVTIGLFLWALSSSGFVGESFVVIAPFPFIFFGKVGLEIGLLILIIIIIIFVFLLRYLRFSRPIGPS